MKRFMDVLAKVENAVCTAGLLGTTFLVFFQIMNRFWLRLDIKWANDLALFMFIFFVLSCIVLTTREDGHTTVDLFVDIVITNPICKAIYILCTRIVAIITVVFFLPTVLDFALDAWKYPQPGNLVRWFNESWLMESLFVCMCFCLLHLVYNVSVGFAKVREMMRENRKTGTD